MISAESDWVDQHAYVQYRLDNEPEARALIDEARKRYTAIGFAVPWTQVEREWSLSRLFQDYRAAVRKAARFLGLGTSRALHVHELVVADGYTLARSPGPASRPPQPGVASAIHADTTGDEAWRSGRVANRQVRQRYLSATKFKF